MAPEQAGMFRIPTADDSILVEIVRRLVEAHRPERIYPREMQDCDIAYRALRGLGVANDVLVWSRSEFQKRLHLKSSLPSTILREGKLLHAA